MNIKVLLVDDHKIIRQGLRLLLDKQSGIEVVAEAGDGRTAVQLVTELRPDMVIMDVIMPDLNGIEATRQIVDKLSGVKVIALSMHSDALFISEMLKNGASGYLLKDCAFEELNNAVRTVAGGEIYLGPTISGIVVDDYLHRLLKSGSSDSSVLTRRENEVLQLIAEGKSTKQIALELHISVKTVETHRRQIMGKLDIHSVAELTKYAIRKGLTSLDM